MKYGNSIEDIKYSWAEFRAKQKYVVEFGCKDFVKSNNLIDAFHFGILFLIKEWLGTKELE